MMAEMDDTPLLENIHLSVVEDETNTLQIVLLGKTGSGKSSLGNTIFEGRAEFNVSHSAGSETKVCQTKTQTVNGRKLCLIDTPGLFDTDLDNTELSFEDVRLLIECCPGIHTFLILLKVEKFTKHEKEVTEAIFKQFTEEALKYTTLVFTHGDQLPDEITIESWVEDNARVKDLVQKCGGRCHVFDNKYWNNSEHPYRNNQVQIENLLNTIEETVRQNGGRCYTNDDLLTIEREIQQVILQLNESSPGDDPQTRRNEAKEIALKNIWPKIKNVAVGCTVGVLVGAALVPVSVFLIPCAITGAAVAGVGVVALGTVGGLAGQVSKLKKEKEKEN